MQLSYWEIKSWFTNVDFTIVGSGIVGLQTANFLKDKYPDSKIIILERGSLPQGASTKNAGFACFGSVSEILSDLKSHSEDEVLHLIEKRFLGLELLRNQLGDSNIDYQNNGGYEVFLNSNSELYQHCLEQTSYINKLVKPLFNKDIYEIRKDNFNFQNTYPNLILNTLEGQIDTGKMIQTLLKRVLSKDILILNHQEVIDFSENNSYVTVITNDFSFETNKLIFTTNGFASKLTNNEVLPARAQVLITEPIPNLHIKGTFHLDEGYYYFRNIENRILFGGGRNLDFEGETTTELNTTEIIQNKLDELLNSVILPNTPVSIEHRWSGIMGVGSQKKPIVKALSEHVYCGVRMGGMGVAIGSLIGKELAELID